MTSRYFLRKTHVPVPEDPKSLIEQERKKTENLKKNVAIARKVQDFFVRINNLNVPGAGFGVEGARAVADFLESYYPADVRFSRETQRILEESLRLAAEVNANKSVSPADAKKVSTAIDELLQIVEKFQKLPKSEKLKLIDFYEAKINTFAIEINSIVNEILLEHKMTGGRKRC
jgi:hypothetical protein